MKLHHPFDTFKSVVEQLHPTVERLEIDHWCDGVKPIHYVSDGLGRSEFPPVLRWRIGKERFAFVLKPKLKTRQWSMCFGLASGSTTTPVYDDDVVKTVLHVIEMSVRGCTTKEINAWLESMERDTSTH